MTGPRISRQRGEAPDSALDFAYLARQTLDDAELQHELLRAFLAQAEGILRQLQRPNPLTPPKKANFAHLLKGSALAIGAGRVAAAAEVLEIGIWKKDGGEDAALTELAASIAEASDAIDLFFARQSGK